jgi:uncharacterized protein (TIGR03067 family)
LLFFNVPEEARSMKILRSKSAVSAAFALSFLACIDSINFAPMAQASPTKEASQKAEMTRLQGEWSMVMGERGGQKLPDAIVSTGRRVAKGNNLTVTVGGQTFMKATFTVNPSKKPKSIDYMITEGPDKGKKQLGIYELNSDTVRFCFSTPGKDRPAQFSTSAEDGRTLSTWKRLKK